jgi:hypothetical protein
MLKRGKFLEIHFFIIFASAIIVGFVFLISYAIVNGNQEEKIIRNSGGNVNLNLAEKFSMSLGGKNSNEIISENTPSENGLGNVNIPSNFHGGLFSDFNIDPQGDLDNDGIVNVEDIDIDGDRMLNSDD